MKIVILDDATLGGDIDLSCFQEFGTVVKYPTSDYSDVPERIKDCDICIVNKVRLDSVSLATADKLKLICVTATGYDNIDTAYCKERGIAVCNVAGYSVNSVSQLTLAMVLSASVKLPTYVRSVSDGTYSAGSVQNILTPSYNELAGKVWGIIGYGAIGKKVGDAAKALGCRVVVNKRTPVENEECLPLEELLKISDIITIHVPLSDATRGLIGENELKLMKDGIFLVNVARGAVTDEEAVTRAVQNGKIGFFGCDVYSTEPMPDTHPFYRIRNLENVYLTPHMAWGAVESRARCISEICGNIQSFLSGGNKNRIV